MSFQSIDDWVSGCKPLRQGSSVSSPQAKSGPRRPSNWPSEQPQNAEDIYYIFFKIHFYVLAIYIFIFIIHERLILVKLILLSHARCSVITVIIMFGVKSTQRKAQPEVIC